MHLTTSLIVPVFNEERYLPLLLDSLVAQTILPDEIIICDNNSTDHSVDIASSYLSQLPLKIIHQPKKGIIPTMELAWRSAKGTIIIRTDADAILPPDYVSNAITYLDHHGDIQAATGPIYNAEKEDSLMSLVFLFSCVYGNLLLQLLRGYPIILGPNSIFRRSALEFVGGYKTNTPSVDDQLITRKIHQSGGKIRYSFSLACAHSCRRWRNNPKALLQTIRSLFNPIYYQEKSG